MTPGVDLEGLQMSSDPLPVDDLHRRVADTVGKLDAGALSQLSMRPDRGCGTWTDGWIKSLGLSMLKVYVNGNNLFLWTDMPDDHESWQT